MKTFRTGFSIVPILAAASLFACGGSKGGGDSPTPVPEQVVAEEPAPVTETPAVTPTPAAVKLVFKETNVDLVGDFRVFKVKRDSTGNFYVAFVSDVKPTPDATAEVPGYTVIKFDQTGKELWRFPTLENSLVSNPTSGSAGSYMLGILADMDVSPEGRILMVGVKTVNTDIAKLSLSNFSKTLFTKGVVKTTTTAADGTATVTTVDSWTGNVNFFVTIDGSGLGANDPSITSEHFLASSIAWKPISAKYDDDTNSFVLVSSTGGSGLAVMQAQRIKTDFSTVKESVCYAAQQAHAPTTDRQFVNMSIYAPEASTVKMSAAPTLSVESGKAEDLLALVKANDAGRCWNIFTATLMTETEEGITIYKPKNLAAGESMESQVEYIEDLFSKANEFKAYKIHNELFSQSETWINDMFGPQYLRIEGATTTMAAVGNGLAHFSFANQDMAGHKQLIVGNGLNAEDDGWKVFTKSNSNRSPGSLDIINAGTQVVAAWTDLHAAGETNADNRALRLVRMPANDLTGTKTTYESHEVPASTGHSTFSSVRLAAAKDGTLVVFATVGTKLEGTSPQSARLKQATLLIGITE